MANVCINTDRGEEVGISEVYQTHDSLHLAAQLARKKLVEEIDSRVFVKRFTQRGIAAGSCSFAFDLCLFFYPGNSNLSYIKALVKLLNPAPAPPAPLSALQMASEQLVAQHATRMNAYNQRMQKWVADCTGRLI